MTGWSYTKVNRLLTEGRRAFLRRVSGIERGAECARYEALLSALADGEASAEQLATLRPHMRTCLSCRARLREFRATPERVAALVPPAALVASDGGGPLRSLLESVVGRERALPRRRRARHGPEDRRGGGVRCGAGRRRHGDRRVREPPGPAAAASRAAGGGPAREGRDACRNGARAARRDAADGACTAGSTDAASTRAATAAARPRRRVRPGRRRSGARSHTAAIPGGQLRARGQRPDGRLRRRQRRVRALAGGY